jgi:hypothetical protein
MTKEKRMNEDFMTEAEIRSFFKGVKAGSLKHWYKVQGPKLSGQGRQTYSRYTKFLNGMYNYDTITDEWFKWYLKRSDGQDNVSLFNATNSQSIYFVEAMPFQRPYFRRITMEQKASLLVPIYSFSASSEEYPSLNPSQLIELIKADLLGIRWGTVKTTFDGKDVYGYCVIRDKPLTISNIPSQNITKIGQKRLQSGDSINVYHGGLWLLIKQEDLPPGDHLLYFSADSKNFETEAKILINAMY